MNGLRGLLRSSEAKMQVNLQGFQPSQGSQATDCTYYVFDREIISHDPNIYLIFVLVLVSNFVQVTNIVTVTVTVML
mgnify:CR=1 FL=1